MIGNYSMYIYIYITCLLCKYISRCMYYCNKTHVLVCVCVYLGCITTLCPSGQSAVDDLDFTN